MVKNQKNLDIPSMATAETLWGNFEQTGSVTAFLKYCQKAKETNEAKIDSLPS